MKEYDNSKIPTYKQQLPIVYMSSNNFGHLITSNITTLQHLATLRYTSPNYTSPNYTSLHLSTLHFLSFTLHYPLICLNPFTFPAVLFHLASLNYIYIYIYIYIHTHIYTHTHTHKDTLSRAKPNFQNATL